MTIFSPDVAEDEIQSTIEAVVGYITDASGENVEFNRDSPWGRRRLAYAVRHASRDVRDGFYTLYHFQVAPHRVIDIEREIKLNDRIMRYLLTQYTPRPIDETATVEAAGETADEASTGGGDQNRGEAQNDVEANDSTPEAVAQSDVAETVSTEPSDIPDSTESESPASSDSSEEPSTEEA
jgi:small subunit ribosomal protein S6